MICQRVKQTKCKKDKKAVVDCINESFVFKSFNTVADLEQLLTKVRAGPCSGLGIVVLTIHPIATVCLIVPYKGMYLTDHCMSLDKGGRLTGTIT